MVPKHTSLQPVPQAERPTAELLAVPIAALVSFQQVTQQADAKGTTLMTVHVGLAALVATQVGQLVGARVATPAVVTLWALTGLYLVSFAGCGYALIQVIRPRRARSTLPNPFAFPTPDHSSDTETARPGERSGPPDRTPGPVDHSAQLWETAGGIAAIAVQKNRYVSIAIAWTVVMVISVMAWIALAAFCSR